MSDELKDQRIPIMMTPSEVKAIDDWMFANRIKSRAEAIRRLCQTGLSFDTTIDNILANHFKARDAFYEHMGNVDADTMESLSDGDKFRKFLSMSKAFIDYLEKNEEPLQYLAVASRVYRASDFDYQKMEYFYDNLKNVLDSLDTKASDIYKSK